MRQRLQVGVPAKLLELPPVDGHRKMWNRVLGELRGRVRIVALGTGGEVRMRWPRPRPEVVLANGHEDLPATDAPLVIQVHEAGWFEPALRELIDPDFYAYLATRTERAVAAAAQIIMPSERAADDLAAAYGVERTRIHVVPHGVDPVFRPRSGAGRGLVARAAGRDSDYVLYAATLHPRKNLGALRQAMALLAREGLPHLLVVAGRPAPDRADSTELERAAAAELPGAAGRIVRIRDPSDDELAGLMADAAAFCLPSLYEGFGMTALEAMACGAPVVVSDRGALPEVVGDAGLVVAPEPEALAAALRTVLSDARLGTRLRDGGIARAASFTWQRTAAGWLEVLKAAAQAHHSRSGPPYTRAR